LPVSQAVTASPSDSRSFTLVAEKTFTTLTLSALTDASPVPDASASSNLLCTIDHWSSEPTPFA